MHLLHCTNLSSTRDHQHIPAGLYSKLKAAVRLHSRVSNYARKDAHHPRPHRLLAIFGHRSDPAFKSTQVFGYGKLLRRKVSIFRLIAHETLSEPMFGSEELNRPSYGIHFRMAQPEVVRADA